MISTYNYLIKDTELDLTLFSNTAAYLYETLKNINWAGFYFNIDGQLQLGPFVGKVACEKIPFDKGVCGASFSKRETVVVKDVHQFEGHIACDSASNSEIVIPLIINNQCIGVLDIDSFEFDNFNEEVTTQLEKLVEVLLNQYQQCSRKVIHF